MAHRKSRNPNHPRKGSSIKVEPIRDIEDIWQIKRFLHDHPRDLCLFVLGINTAFRASELLSITVGQVEHSCLGDLLEIKQRKTGKYRAVALNRSAITAIRFWLNAYPESHRRPESALFRSRTGEALKVPTVTRMVKKWAEMAGLRGNYGSHSLRKTWGYHQRVQMSTAVPILMEAFGHSNQKQTLDYLGIQSGEIMDIYLKLEL
ncbi:MAG: tyrosine-type recombinase/integrase [Gammaproteobacteria bacterium]|nr:tyrosine-type recombinase/integrase [Gammaproteobacteria bacterium]